MFTCKICLEHKMTFVYDVSLTVSNPLCLSHGKQHDKHLSLLSL